MRKNKFFKIIVMITIFFLGIVVAVVAPNDELKDLLVTLAQLNVAIAVGIGAISIGFLKERKVQRNLTEVAIGIVTLSVLTFLIAHIDWFLIISRIYFILNILVICTLLFVTQMVTEVDKE